MEGHNNQFNSWLELSFIKHARLFIVKNRWEFLQCNTIRQDIFLPIHASIFDLYVSFCAFEKSQALQIAITLLWYPSAFLLYTEKAIQVVGLLTLGNAFHD